MKSSISKEDYLKIYELLDSVSPLDYDCGTLCNSICCVCDNDKSKDKDMVIYLLPGEEDLFFENLENKENKDMNKENKKLNKENKKLNKENNLKNKENKVFFDIKKEKAKYYEYPKSWKGYVYFIRCKTPPVCNRQLRPIQCRTFPLSPHISKDKKLHLIYDLDDLDYPCPLISEKIKLNQDFINKTYLCWNILIKDKLIYDLIEMDSKRRDEEKLRYEIIK